MNKIYSLTQNMIEFDAGNARRIQHFIKVHAFAALIAEGEGLDGDIRFTLEAAALVHDIGIKIAEEKFGRCDGKLQEQEGPAAAREMLSTLGFEEERIERICYLVGHHHTYTNVDGMDYQILLEADFLVNLHEGKHTEESRKSALTTIFKTQTGIQICKTMFGL